MVIEKHISNFHATYEELTDEVRLAMHAFVPLRLQEWFAYLDGEPGAAKAIAKLQSSQDFSHWFSMQGRNQKPGVPTLEWPTENDQRLGMQLLLFRSIAGGKVDIGPLGKMYVPGSGRNINDSSKAFVDQVFRPMSRELIRYLRRVGDEKTEESVPAADRVVPLDHNSASYKEAIEAVEHLERVLTEANDFADVDVREQRLAEVKAIRGLLSVFLVRVQAIAILLKPLVIQFGAKLRDSLMAIAVGAVIAALTALLAHVF
ncbi:MAG: hypothetical protein E7813_10325 [Bradyrhizobium sp.]|uniref:hypothetical protein n=1 Tax=Bradyrhizobium sp. TaxID=376 RepID=UPI00121320E0|nr:hypothetical protein [Bradyrhizobium sp.]THD68417.1 MAG: hypothetical protein E7813_10325 [Bradyrhizobium sp.]